jgi:hypothetical protein
MKLSLNIQDAYYKVASSEASTVPSGSEKVMCNKCKGEVSVNRALELLQQQSVHVVSDNLFNLQRDMIELNFLLKSAERRLYC